jgi:hypothetical protein
MSARFRLTIPCLCLLALSALACSKDLPGALKAVPADADVYATLDAKATISHVKALLPKLLPGDLKDQVPSFEALAQQAMQLAGLDISKLTYVHFFGKMGDNSQMVLLAEGLTAQGIKGQKKAEHNGLAIYEIMDRVRYAELPKLGLAFAPNETVLKKVIDTFKGDAKGLESTDKAKLLLDLMKAHEDMDLARFYVLSGKMPPGVAPLVKANGGAMFFDLDTGAAMVVLADKANVDKMDSSLGMGLMAIQAGLMMGGGADMPVKIDKETKTALQTLIGKIKRKKKADRLTVSFKGDLKPLVKKIAALGIGAWREEQAGMATPARIDKPAIPSRPSPPADPAVK